MTQKKVTFDDKSNRVPVGDNRQEKIVAEDVNELKEVINDNSDDAENRLGVVEAGKSDKPTSAIENNIATFDSDRSVKDSGKSFEEGLTDNANKIPNSKTVKAIEVRVSENENNKADKPTSSTENNISVFDANKNPIDSGKSFEDQLTDDVNKIPNSAIVKSIESRVSVNEENISGNLGFITENRGRIENLESNQTTGVQTYSTFADLPPTGAANISYKVTNDPDTSKNGYYTWQTSVYVKEDETGIDFLTKKNGNINITNTYFEEGITYLWVKFDTLFIRGIAGSYTLNWADIKIALPGETFATSTKGVLDCLRMDSLDSLIWDVNTNSVKVVDRASRKLEHYVLIESDAGRVNSGTEAYVDYLNDKVLNTSQLIVSPYSDNKPSIIISNNKLKFIGTIYVYYNGSVRTIQHSSDIEFTFSKDDVLYIDTSTMNIVNDSGYPMANVIKKKTGGLGGNINPDLILTNYYTGFTGGLLGWYIRHYENLINQTYVSPNRTGEIGIRIENNELIFDRAMFFSYRGVNYRLDLNVGQTEKRYSFIQDDFLVINAQELEASSSSIYYFDDFVEVKSGGFGAFDGKDLILTYYYNNFFGGLLGDTLARLQSDTVFKLPESRESRFKHVTNNCASQGLTVNREEIWHFEAAPDDNSSFANIIRFEEGDLTPKVAHTHNLGHAASADYNSETDVMLVGNGSGDTNNKPRLDFILNASSLNGVGTQVIDINGANVISLPLNTAQKEIGGSGAIATWGDDKKTIYLLTGQGSSPRKIFKLRLGYGTEDLSDPGGATGTDITKWGNFIVGKTGEEFNGTAEVVNTYLGEETGVYQGIAFNEGKIYLCCGLTEPIVHVIKVFSNNRYVIEDQFKLSEFDSNGNILSYEPEGVCIYKGVYLMLGVVGSTRHLSIMPLKNKQKGVGVIGTRVDFPFENNAIPTVQITPNSSTADIYISSIDKDGFTVSSVSAGSGNFYWESYIQ